MTRQEHYRAIDEREALERAAAAEARELEPRLEPPCGGRTSASTIAHPPHYTSAVETIDAIEAWGLNYRLGNVVKYISRAGKKDPSKRLEDLEKARWYLDREINKENTK